MARLTLHFPCERNASVVIFLAATAQEVCVMGLGLGFGVGFGLRLGLGLWSNPYVGLQAQGQSRSFATGAV